MRIVGKVVISDVFVSEKEITYYSVVDLGCGGAWSFTLAGGAALDGVTPGSVLEIDGDLKLNRVGKSTYLTVMEGTKFKQV